MQRVGGKKWKYIYNERAVMNMLRITNSAWIINGNVTTKNELMNKFPIQIEKLCNANSCIINEK